MNYKIVSFLHCFCCLAGSHVITFVHRNNIENREIDSLPEARQTNKCIKLLNELQVFARVLLHSNGVNRDALKTDSTILNYSNIYISYLAIVVRLFPTTSTRKYGRPLAVLYENELNST